MIHCAFSTMKDLMEFATEDFMRGFRVAGPSIGTAFLEELTKKAPGLIAVWWSKNRARLITSTDPDHGTDSDSGLGTPFEAFNQEAKGVIGALKYLILCCDAIMPG